MAFAPLNYANRYRTCDHRSISDLARASSREYAHPRSFELEHLPSGLPSPLKTAH